MTFFSPEFFSAVFSIVLMDLVLGGDNAIVIGMAARNLPAQAQKKVILLGTGGAIIIRSLATIVAVYLLMIPGLKLVGGVLLVWMAYKLLVEDKGNEEGNFKTASNFWGAVRTIIIADAVMGLDNVLAVAGASHGSPVLVISGLFISIPIVVWGSTIVIKAMNRFPIIIPLGAAVIAHTAATMIIGEPFVKNMIGESALIEWGVSLFLIAGVLFVGRQNVKQLLKQREEANKQQETAK